MTTFDQVPEEWNPTHLLLIGDTKAGKSTYVAQAAKDGHTILYIDSDNGGSAIRRLLKDDLAAQRRIIYFRTDDPVEFITDILSQGIFRWNITQDRAYSSASGKAGDSMVEIRPARMPRELIMCIDSWTSLSLEALEAGALKRGDTLATLKDANKQGMYGDSRMQLTAICGIIQKVKFHVIALAHPGFYERYEKPTGKAGEVKQKDMILIDTWEIPLSSSNPHGHSMGKFFTDIAWLQIDKADRRVIDFTPRYHRVSGGTVNDKGLVDDLTFSKVFARPVPIELDPSWIRYLTHEEFVAERAASNPSPSQPAGAKADGNLKQEPAKKSISMMGLMKK